MYIKDDLKYICMKQNISLSELARRLERSPQSFIQKLNRGHIELDELQQIADVLGLKVKCEFIMKSGEKFNILK